MNFLIRTQINYIYRPISHSARAFCKPEIPRNVLEDRQSSHQQQKNGFVYDKKPVKFCTLLSMKINVS